MQAVLVSVVIPVYNVTAFLSQAIDSVLMQNYPHTEIIVADDGSAPDAAAHIATICNAYPLVRLIRFSHRGPACTRRDGMREARGAYIWFLDADDVLLPGAFTRLTAALSCHPQAIGAYGSKITMDRRGKLLKNMLTPTDAEAISGDILPALLKGVTLLSNGSVCIRREALERIDFPEQLRQGEDWVTWCRLALLGEFVYAGPAPVLCIRMHEENVSSRVGQSPQVFLRMLDTIFNDPVFATRVGHAALDEYRMRHSAVLTRYLAILYRQQGRVLRSFWYRTRARRLFHSLPRKKTRVVHVVKWFYAGGAERLLTSLLTHSDRDRFEHVVISLSDQGERLGDIRRTHNISYRAFGIHPGWKSFMGYMRAFFYLRSLRPDVIKTWLPPGNIAGGIMARILGIPVIWGIHDAQRPPYQWSHVIMQKRLRFIPDRVICCSELVYDLCRDMGYDPGKLTVVPNGTDADQFRHVPEGRVRVRKELSVSEDTLLIGMVAEDTALKRHHHFLIAAKLFLRTHPEARFLFCGKGMDALNERLQYLIHFLDLGDYVHLLGIRNDMADIYSALDIHTLNSRSESFGLAAVEAVACETLSVATDTGVMPDLLNGVGIIYPIEDAPGSLVDAWSQCSAWSAEEKKTRRERGRARVITDYSIVRAAQGYDEEYLRYALSNMVTLS